MTTETLRLRPGPEHDSALSVPVAVPVDIDPAVLSSVVEAIEKALVVLVHAGRNDVVARADRVAELATGLLEPSSELLEDQVRRMGTLRQVFAAGDRLTAEQLNLDSAVDRSHPLASPHGTSAFCPRRRSPRTWHRCAPDCRI